jgi:hypothetical protein
VDSFGSVRKDTFKIINGDWYSRYDGKYYLLFPEDMKPGEKYVRQIDMPDNHFIEVEKNLFFMEYTVTGIKYYKGEKIYLMKFSINGGGTVSDPLDLYFDPDIGIVYKQQITKE